MSEKLDRTNLTSLIHTTTQEIISNTKSFIQSVNHKPLGTDTVTIMMNGLKVELNKEDYYEMKLQNNEIKAKIKKDMQKFKSTNH